MDARVTDETLVFEGWHFDRQARLLYREDASGTWTPVPLGSRAQAILTLLLEQPGTLVSKDADHGSGVAEHRRRAEQPKRSDCGVASRAGSRSVGWGATFRQFQDEDTGSSLA